MVRWQGKGEDGQGCPRGGRDDRCPGRGGIKEVAELYRTRQDDARTRAQLLREELAETVDHAMKAAGHAASGVRSAGVQMAPAAGRFRDAASQRWETAVAAFNDTSSMTGRDLRGMRKARRAQRTLARRRGRGRAGVRPPRMVGLLTAGVAVGAATALVLRRRRQHWEEYDASQALEAVGATGPAAEAGPVGESAPEPPGTAPADIYGSGAAQGESVEDLIDREQSERPQI